MCSCGSVVEHFVSSAKRCGFNSQVTHTLLNNVKLLWIKGSAKCINTFFYLNPTTLFQSQNFYDKLYWFWLQFILFFTIQSSCMCPLFAPTWLFSITWPWLICTHIATIWNWMGRNSVCSMLFTSLLFLVFIFENRREDTKQRRLLVLLLPSCSVAFGDLTLHLSHFLVFSVCQSPLCLSNHCWITVYTVESCVSEVQV